MQGSMTTKLIKPIEFFKTVPLFKGLSDHALTTLAGNVPTADYSPGDTIVAEGTFGDTLYIIEQGSVEAISKLDRFDEQLVSVLGPRQVFGESGVLETSIRSNSIRAREESTVIHAIHRSDLHRLFKMAPEQYALLVLNIARLLSRKLSKSFLVNGYASRTDHSHPKNNIRIAKINDTGRLSAAA